MKICYLQLALARQADISLAQRSENGLRRRRGVSGENAGGAAQQQLWASRRVSASAARSGAARRRK
jgi:hypothetical protein